MDNARTLQSIFRRWYPHYRKHHGVSHAQSRAAHALMQCQTEAMGGDEWYCPNDDYHLTQYHSCRHRSCPRCHGAATQEWLERMLERLLPTSHYHVVFTLPHELNVLWHYNREWFHTRLFQAVAETLRQLLADERFLGAEPGIVLALHTWGRTLSFHPHIHALVTAGGLVDGNWRETRKDYLLPVKALKAKFRGKWIAWLNRAYEAGALTLPPDWTPGRFVRVMKGLSKREWNLRIESQYRHGQGVAKYLSRYVKGGPLKDQRIVAATDQHIAFRYTDHHDGRTKTLALAPEPFVQRILSHVPVPGRHTVRYYGLYASKAEPKRHQACRSLGRISPTPDKPPKCPPRTCKACGAELKRRPARGSHRISSRIRCVPCATRSSRQPHGPRCTPLKARE